MHSLLLSNQEVKLVNAMSCLTVYQNQYVASVGLMQLNLIKRTVQRVLCVFDMALIYSIHLLCLINKYMPFCK